MKTPYPTSENATCEDCGSPAALRGGGLPNLCSAHFRKSQLRTKPRERIYCAAIGRRQSEAATWGAANVGCGNMAALFVTDEDGTAHPVCYRHADAVKRYGWNR